MSKKLSFRGTVFIGRENTVKMKVQEHDPDANTTVDKEWSGVDRMVLSLFEITDGVASTAPVVTVDTEVDAAAIDYSTDGQIVFKLGDISKDAGGAMTPMVCAMRLTAYSSDADTEIIHEATHDASLRFVAAG